MKQTILRCLGYIGSFSVLMTLITALLGFMSWASDYVNGVDLVIAFVTTILIMMSGQFRITFEEDNDK